VALHGATRAWRCPLATRGGEVDERQITWLDMQCNQVFDDEAMSGPRQWVFGHGSLANKERCARVSSARSWLRHPGGKWWHKPVHKP
jgi:hypothetical protein